LRRLYPAAAQSWTRVEIASPPLLPIVPASLAFDVFHLFACAVMQKKKPG
jgi:hypothetical protein